MKQIVLFKDGKSYKVCEKPMRRKEGEYSIKMYYACKS